MPIVLPALLAEDESSGSIDEEQIAIDARPRFPDDAYSEKLADDWWKRWGDQKDLLSKARPVAGLRITRPHTIATVAKRSCTATCTVQNCLNASTRRSSVRPVSTRPAVRESV